MRLVNVTLSALALSLTLGAAIPAVAQEQAPEPAKPSVQPIKPGQSNPAIQPTPAPVDPEKAPKCVVKETEFNAGEITKGEVVKHEFIVENQGKGPLEITRVQPACGCTLSEYDKSIEPGKTGKITLSVNTTTFRGPISKSTSVATNDPMMASFQLIIKAEIKEIIAVKPSENMQMGLIYTGQEVVKEFTLASTDDQPFAVTQVESTDSNVKYDLAMGADKKSATFRVTVPAERPVGPVNARFTLHTDHPKVPTISLNCFGTVREPLTVYPMEITYSGLAKEFIEKNPADNSLTKPVTVAFETAADLEVKSAKCDLPFVKVVQDTLEQGKRYSIKVQLQPEGLKVGDFAGVLTIETNKKTVTIPVKGKIF